MAINKLPPGIWDDNDQRPKKSLSEKTLKEIAIGKLTVAAHTDPVPMEGPSGPQYEARLCLSQEFDNG